MSDSRQRLLLLIISLLLVFPHAHTRAASIDVFNADITLKKDSTVQITEYISYNFSDEHHGFTRCIHRMHHDRPSSILKERYIDITVNSVVIDGTSSPFATDVTNENVCIRMGDPEKTITGAHTFVLTYTVFGGFSYPDYGGAEWYWDVTGDQWEIPIHLATARINAPSDMLRPEHACYFGQVEGPASCEYRHNANGTTVYLARQLIPRHSFVVSQAVERGGLPYDVRERYKKKILYVALAILGILLISLFLTRRWMKKNTDEPLNIVYDPYKDLSPIESGYILEGRLTAAHITAGLWTLGEQGYVTITKESETNFTCTLQKPLTEHMRESDRAVLTLLFHEHMTHAVTLDTLPIGTNVTFANMVQFLERVPQKYKDALLVAIIQSLVQRKFLKENAIIAKVQNPVVLTLFFVSVVAIKSQQKLLVLLGGAILVMLIVFIMTFQQRTKKGHEARMHMTGFKQFLSVTDGQRFILHNPPEKNAAQFLAHLPFGIAFAVLPSMLDVFRHVPVVVPPWFQTHHTVDTDTVSNLIADIQACIGKEKSTSVAFDQLHKEKS